MDDIDPLILDEAACPLDAVGVLARDDGHVRLVGHLDLEVLILRGNGVFEPPDVDGGDGDAV
nr:hypothetical protein [Candidatus Halobonum tyrrellensis]